MKILSPSAPRRINFVTVSVQLPAGRRVAASWHPCWLPGSGGPAPTPLHWAMVASLELQFRGLPSSLAARRLSAAAAADGAVQGLLVAGVRPPR